MNANGRIIVAAIFIAKIPFNFFEESIIDVPHLFNQNTFQTFYYFVSQLARFRHQRILTNRLNRCKYIIEFASVIQMWFKTWRNCNECFCYRRSSISKLQLYATDLVETLKLLENNKNWSFCCILKMPRQWICKYPYETLRSRPRPRWIFHSWCNCRTYHEHRHPFSSPFSPQIVFSYFSQL